MNPQNRLKKNYINIITHLIFFSLGAYVTIDLYETHQPIYQIDKNQINICFTPAKKCLPQILHEIENAKNEILIQAYSFTEKNIANELIKAHQKGIKIRIILDKSQLNAKGSKLKELAKTGIECQIDDKMAIAHNKVIIIDSKIVITGSYNFSQAAESHNSENLLIINNIEIAKEYKQNWQKREKLSKFFFI